jgi:hypothetical protein
MLTRDPFFVSYTLRDGLLDAASLAQVSHSLEALGRPYVDLLQNRSRDPQRHVLSMLGGAAFLVALVSPAYLSSEWVRLELSAALQRRLPIILTEFPYYLKKGSPLRISSLRNLRYSNADLYMVGEEETHNPALHQTANALRALAAR